MKLNTKFCQITLGDAIEFIRARTDTNRFAEADPRTVLEGNHNEYVFDLPLSSAPVRVRWITSINKVTGRTNPCGTDSMKVCAVDRDNRGLVRSVRVFRTKNWRSTLTDVITAMKKQAYINWMKRSKDEQAAPKASVPFNYRVVEEEVIGRLLNMKLVTSNNARWKAAIAKYFPDIAEFRFSSPEEAVRWFARHLAMISRDVNATIDGRKRELLDIVSADRNRESTQSEFSF
jgi:hypothetical protein